MTKGTYVMTKNIVEAAQATIDYVCGKCPNKEDCHDKDGPVDSFYEECIHLPLVKALQNKPNVVEVVVDYDHDTGLGFLLSEETFEQWDVPKGGTKLRIEVIED